MLKLKLLLAIAVLTLFTPLFATAGDLAPGGSTAPDQFKLGYAGSDYGGVILKQTPHAPFGTVSTNTVTFDIYMEAVSDPTNVYCAGCVDFIVQVLNESGSSANIASIQWAGFSGYRTDPGYDLFSVGGVHQCGPEDNGFCQADYIPGTVSRDLSGDVLTFSSFAFPPGSATGVIPDEATVDLVVKTNARHITDPGVTIVSSDNGQGTIMLFGPSGPPAPTPEPGSLALFAGGILGLGFTATRRTRSASSLN